MKHILTLIFLLTSLTNSITQHVSESKQQQIDQLCQETFDEANFPGMAVMVARGDEIVWSKGYGHSDIENDIAIDPYKSVFRIGSISKTITAAGLAILVESGKIDIDKPVQDYVPYFPLKQYPLTVRQICGHIGGIRHYEGMEFMSNIEYKDVASGIEIFKDSDLLFEPGTKYAYSSYGWNLVSAVIEGGADQSFRKFMDEKVFGPSEMNTIYAEGEDVSHDHMVKFYMHDEDGKIVPSWKVNNSLPALSTLNSVPSVLPTLSYTSMSNV